MKTPPLFYYLIFVLLLFLGTGVFVNEKDCGHWYYCGLESPTR
jgi:hypothetical protein